MGVRKVAILSIARDDIGEISIYVSADGLEAVSRLTDKILGRIAMLAELPLAGKIVPDPELAKRDYRMSVVDRYIIFYRVVDDTIVIYRVLHGAREYSYLLE